MHTLAVGAWAGSLAVGIAYGVVTALSVLALVPISEGLPMGGPLLVVLVLNGLLAIGVVLIRRLTSLLPEPSKSVVLAMTIGVMILFTFYAGDYSAIPMLLLFALLACGQVWIVYRITSKDEAPGVEAEE